MAKVDKDLKRVGRVQAAAQSVSKSFAGPGLALLFLAAVAVAAAGFAAPGPMQIYVVVAALIGGYMALTIGANDVANNMGPAVGGRVLKLGAALVIAAICEAAGAILAGGDVVSTISKNIITPDPDMSAQAFVLAMTSALLAAAVWVHVATWLGAPVSTTHAIVGAVLGAGVASAGAEVVNWPTMGGIAASWVISPVLGALGAAGLLAFIKWRVLFPRDRVAAARRWVPVLIALMAGVFAMYLVSKGLSRVWKPDAEIVLLIGAGAFAVFWAVTRPLVARRAQGMENRKREIAKLFGLPLIFAAALLSFAHGANDVANAVGPLAAIAAAAEIGHAAPEKVALPLWILAIGALGLAAGLGLFGSRVIRMVGEQITKMDPMRAYCVALSAAATVLVASAMGLPVSSTHIAVGGVFGVGFLREAMTNRGLRRRDAPIALPSVEAARAIDPAKVEKKAIKREKRRLVRRRHAWSIAAAWVVTVPAAGLMSALIYWALSAATPG